MPQTTDTQLRQEIRRLRTEIAAAGRTSPRGRPNALDQFALSLEPTRNLLATAPALPAALPGVVDRTGSPTPVTPAEPSEPEPAEPEPTGPNEPTTPEPEPEAASEEDIAARLAELEAKLQQLNDQQRAKNVAYLRKVGQRTQWGALVALAVGAGLILFMDQPLRSDSRFQMAWLAAVTVWLVVAAISAVRRSEGGMTPMLLGKDGRFSTSHFQAWIWTIMISWGFFFFIASGLAAGNLDGFNDETVNLDADYLLLLGGPFAALVAAKALTAAKSAAGDLQQVSTEQARVTDVLSNDDGRTDLVDSQYLFFNFVALVAFLALFALEPKEFPDLPDGLVMLTSASALTYVANKAVVKNAPGILSITRDTGEGLPRVGEVIRIHGFNFVPPGGATEESLTRVRVRFSGVEAPVAPLPIHENEPAVQASAAPEADEPNTPRRGAALYVDNVTATDLRVKIPEMPEFQLPATVEVTVVTAAGVETAPPYRLTIGAAE